jgi:hypothetical protein
MRLMRNRKIESETERKRMRRNVRSRDCRPASALFLNRRDVAIVIIAIIVTLWRGFHEKDSTCDH